MSDNQQPPAPGSTMSQGRVDRLESELVVVKRQLQAYLQLVRWRDGPLADAIADEIAVTLEDYQDDGGGRVSICLEHDEVTVDLSHEDEFVPARLKVVKQLPDGETAQFAARLQADQLRYAIEYRP